MPNHLRALFVILALASLVFAFARTATAPLIADADLVRRRNLWLGLTFIAYLAHNFWVCLFASAVLLWHASGKEHNRVALFFFVLFAIPPLTDQLPGLGIANYLFDIDYLRLLSLTVLFPAALNLLRDHKSAPLGRGACDKLLLAYVAYNLALIFISSSITHFLRNAFVNTIDILLPYYVASRTLRRQGEFRDALASFVVGACLLAAIGIFESAKGWLMYAPLKTALNNHTEIMNKLLRGDIQRAMASTGQPIIFGYVMAVAIGLWLYLQPQVTRPHQRLLPLLLLITGLIATLSRGPWVGAAALSVVFVLTGPQSLRYITKLTTIAAVTIGIAIITPGGEKLIGILPFIGESEDVTVDYRQRLIDVFVPIILDNPVLGASGHLNSDEVESLRQGEGIIDVVNSFIGVGLQSGLVGLALFSTFFCSVGVGVWRSLRLVAARDAEMARLGQALLAVLAGILVTISTVSSISAIPYIYWAMAGVGVAYIEAISLAGKPVLVASAIHSAGGNSEVAHLEGVIVSNGWPKNAQSRRLLGVAGHRSDNN